MGDLVKVKVKMTVECEMELNPDYYKSGASFADMVSVEQDNARGDPFLYLEIMLDDNNGTVDLDIEEVVA